MINKRFLVPVLAFVACGLPAGASIVEYCSGNNPNCSTNSQAAFNNAVTTDNYTYAYAGLQSFSAGNGMLSGDMYTDTLTQIAFVDYAGGSPNGAFSDAGGTLSSPTSGDYTIQITIPATYLAVAFTINVQPGLCDNYCPELQTSGFVGFINNSPVPDSPWIVNISPLGANGVTQIVNFNAASAQGPVGDTPEVGTLILIGTGLISMRWIKRWPRRVFRIPQTA